jgi:uncharacterized phiE125 gp8 family phage protein
MAVTITTPATSTALTTVAAVKQAMGLSVNTFDGLLTRLIDAATDALQEYSGRIFTRQVYTETLEGTAHPYLMLTHAPIESIASVVADSEVVTDYTIRDAETATLFRQVGWQRTAWVGWDVERYNVPGTAELTIVVEYTAGWLLPGDTGRDLPERYEEAAIRTVQTWMQRNRRGGGDVESRKVGDLMVEYRDIGDEIMALPSDARALVGRRALV